MRFLGLQPISRTDVRGDGTWGARLGCRADPGQELAVLLARGALDGLR